MVWKLLTRLNIKLFFSWRPGQKEPVTPQAQHGMANFVIPLKYLFKSSFEPSLHFHRLLIELAAFGIWHDHHTVFFVVQSVVAMNCVTLGSFYSVRSCNIGCCYRVPASRNSQLATHIAIILSSQSIPSVHRVIKLTILSSSSFNSTSEDRSATTQISKTTIDGGYGRKRGR